MIVASTHFILVTYVLPVVIVVAAFVLLGVICGLCMDTRPRNWRDS